MFVISGLAYYSSSGVDKSMTLPKLMVFEAIDPQKPDG
jgi:hypothetical protein